MVDGGRNTRQPPPAGKYLALRQQDPHQFDWIVGRNFHALRQADAVSPKLRAPTHADVFGGFAAANRIVAHDFVAIGALTPGGLSNAWGCGVACMTAAELDRFPVDSAEMRRSYEAVARRVGVSGGCADDLSELFGLDEWSQSPVPLDELQSSLLTHYSNLRGASHLNGFLLGRSRVAALTSPLSGRHECDRSGMCLWGCARRALYSATDDLELLHRRPGFLYKPGFIVERVHSKSGVVTVEGIAASGTEILHARRVLLAAGTLASTRLGLLAINHRNSISMQSCPTAAFMLWLPRYLGRRHEHAFGLGQLSFFVALANDHHGFGSLFNTTGIPIAEFVRHLPMGKRYGIDFLTKLLSSCVVGNLFLPGSLSNVSLQLDGQDQLTIRGGYREEVAVLMREAQRKLRKNFWQLGAIMMPKSFTLGRPGSDIHYAASLPMSAEPVVGQTDRYGELVGGPGIHVVDGASLSFLPAKSHTLTIMANSDRIAKHLVSTLKASAAGT